MKSKKLNKRLPLAILVLIIFCALFALTPISVFGYDGEADLTADAQPSGANTENDESEEKDESIGEESGEEAETNENIFATLFSYLTQHAGEIFSALAFIGSIVLMLCYKKGFLPLLKGGINALSGGVKSLSDETKGIENQANTIFKEASEKLSAAEELLEKISDTLLSLENELGDAKERKESAKRLECVLVGEIDMMYEIFMAAALPQYLKEKVGEQVAKMHRTIEESEKTNEA